jgi:hypothetical protein
MAASGATAQDITAGLAAVRLMAAPPPQLTAAALAAGKKRDANEFPALSAAVAPNGLSRVPLQGRGRLVRNQAPQSGDTAVQAAWAAHLSQQQRAGEESSEDKYRLLDLLPLCPSHRRREDWNDRQFLSVGIDVETLGLNLCAPEDVYPMLASPYLAGGSGGSLENDLPKCYLFDAPELAAESLQKLSEGTLLFLFYAYAGATLALRPPALLMHWHGSCVLCCCMRSQASDSCILRSVDFVTAGKYQSLTRQSQQDVCDRGSACTGDERQLRAAAELQRRDWFWHKELREWWKKESVSQYVVPPNVVVMRGSFITWEAKTWRAKRHPEATVEEHLVEVIPTLQALKAASDLTAGPR